MRICRWLAVCASLPLSATPALAATTQLFGPGDFGPSTLIGFDEQAHGTAANSLYTALGVAFSYDVANSPVPIIDWSAIDPPTTTTSSPNVLATEDGVNGSVFSEFLDLVFSTPVTEVGAWFGNDQGLALLAFPVTLSVFDASDVLLGFVSVTTNQNVHVDQFIGIRSDDPIARARIDYSASGSSLSVAIDDVIFNAVVPEPASGLLLALGLVGLAARRRA